MKMRVLLTICAFPLVIVLAGCQPPAPEGSAAGKTSSGEKVNTALQGTVKINGSSTVEPISSAVAEAFSEKYPKVSVTVGRTGTGGGFDAFARNELDISNASRPVKPDELEKIKAAGIEFIELPIAYDGLTLVVPHDNTWMDQLTMDEIKKVFVAPGAKTWNEVRDGWPSEEIKVFAPGTDSGTFDYFLEVVAGKGGSLRADMSASEDDNVLVNGVAGTKSSIGFFGVAYYEANKEKLKAVPVVNPQSKEAVLPTAETIEKGTYAPFSRPLFIYVKKDSLTRPEVKAFVKFSLSAVPEQAKRVGYVPLPKTIYDVAQSHFEDQITGTRYLNEDGSKKSGSLSEIYVLPK